MAAPRAQIAVAVVALAGLGCESAPVVATPGPGEAEAAPQAAEPAAAPRPVVPERSVSMDRGACQEWRPGSAPRFVACPDVLRNGEVLTYERDATCRRAGVPGREGQVACPRPSSLVTVPTPDIPGEALPSKGETPPRAP